jgi:hypothetical protein
MSSLLFHSSRNNCLIAFALHSGLVVDLSRLTRPMIVSMDKPVKELSQLAPFPVGGEVIIFPRKPL